VIGFVLVYTVAIMLAVSAPATFRVGQVPRVQLGPGRPLVVLWYVFVLVWRLRKGSAGVKTVEELAAAEN